VSLMHVAHAAEVQEAPSSVVLVVLIARGTGATARWALPAVMSCPWIHPLSLPPSLPPCLTCSCCVSLAPALSASWMTDARMTGLT
jgi:hypothetical protein